MANENQYYRVPFANSGDRQTVPTVAGSGNLDFTNGYGPDYELQQGDPNRKRIPRLGHNEILHGITKNIKQHQEKNFPTWISDRDGTSTPFAYNKGVIVNHSGSNWVSLENSNEDEPTLASAKWREFDFSSINTNHLAVAQFAPYDSQREYKLGETCTTFNATTGSIEVWQSYEPYSNQGHNPQDVANRPEGWTGFPTPCWWIKYHGNEAGSITHWFGNEIPENAIKLVDTDINATFYHRIADSYPDLITGNLISLADVLGRYLRIADGSAYLANSNHEDAIRNFTGDFSQFVLQSGVDNTVVRGIFTRNTRLLDGLLALNSGLSTVTPNDDGVGIDASLVVPTAAQNQPRSGVTNLIMWI